jgi:hypothetical protein
MRHLLCLMLAWCAGHAEGSALRSAREVDKASYVYEVADDSGDFLPWKALRFHNIWWVNLTNGVCRVKVFRKGMFTCSCSDGLEISGSLHSIPPGTGIELRSRGK